jgi:DNA invertase Pin-like site-specific DNA recombinase
MATFWAYGRHSTDKQSLTEESQREQLENYWKLHLKPKGVEWGGFLYDAAQSGGTPLTERPKGRELWVLAQPGDHVGWAKLDRAFRSVTDGSATMHLLKQKGVIVHSIDLSLDTSTPMGGFIFHVLLAFAELERHHASTRTSEAMAIRKSTGLAYCGMTPIGWKILPNAYGATVVPDLEERAFVAQLFASWQAGESIEAIVLRLGYEKRTRSGKGKRRGWSHRTVKRAFVAMHDGFPKKAGVDHNRFKPRSGEVLSASS